MIFKIFHAETSNEIFQTFQSALTTKFGMELKRANMSGRINIEEGKKG